MRSPKAALANYHRRSRRATQLVAVSRPLWCVGGAGLQGSTLCATQSACSQRLRHDNRADSTRVCRGSFRSLVARPPARSLARALGGNRANCERLVARLRASSATPSGERSRRRANGRSLGLIQPASSQTGWAFRASRLGVCNKRSASPRHGRQVCQSCVASCVW